MAIRAEAALAEPRAARRAFDRAARRFATACFVHDETRARLLARLDLTRLEPRVVVDLGAAHGAGARALAARYPTARVLAIDASVAMLRAGNAAARSDAIADLGGDAERLPLRAVSVDLLFANLVLPWCRPPAVFAEAARVLRDGGLLTFATLGPDTLQELRRAWAAVDDAIHVHAFFDMHDLGDLALQAGLAEPVVDVDRIEISYADLGAAIGDLRACGAVNVAAARRRSLTGRARWDAFEQRLRERQRLPRLTLTLEVIFGQAWGRGAPASREPAGNREVSIAIDRIDRRTRR